MLRTGAPIKAYCLVCDAHWEVSAAERTGIAAALSKKPEIFNNFARVKHASIFETIRPVGAEAEEALLPAPIQKLMSVPIMDRHSTVLGVIQISRKGLDPRFTEDFSREDLHDLELAAGVLAASPVMQTN